jgi:hypothetical protein
MYSIAKTNIIPIVPESVNSFSSSTLQKLCPPTLAFTVFSDPAKFITPLQRYMVDLVTHVEFFGYTHVEFNSDIIIYIIVNFLPF